MAIEIDITCPNGYHNGNSDWVAIWVNATPQAREQWDAYLRSTGMTTAFIVDFNNSVAPDYFYVPGHRCYDASKMGQITGSGTHDRNDTEKDNSEGQDYFPFSNPTFSGFGAGLINSDLLRKMVPFLVLGAIALAVIAVRGNTR